MQFISRTNLSTNLLTGLSAALLFGAPAVAQRTLQLEQPDLVRIERTPYEPSFESSSEETEGDMNCFEVVFARTGLRAIVQNFPDMGPEFAYHQRVLAKALMQAVVLQEGNSLNEYHQDGVLFGIEYDWFYPTPGMTRPNLPRTVDVVLEREGKSMGRFGTVFGFREAEYREHKAMVEDMIGHPMVTHLVWERDTLETGMASLSIGGMDNQLHGPISAAGNVQMSGRHNSLFGPLQVGGAFHLLEGNSVQYVQSMPAGALPALPSGLDELRTVAREAGTYFPGNAVIGSVLPPSGIVFAEGHLRVDANAAVGRWTLVSAGGDVELRGNDLSLRPSHGTVAAVAFQGSLRVTGNGNQVVGELLAPQGNLDVLGSANTLLGASCSAGVLLLGTGNVITDGTETLPTR